MTDQLTSSAILAEKPTKAHVMAARKFVESCPYTTTALLALADAVWELCEGSEFPQTQAECIERAAHELAPIEAEQV